MSAGARVCEGAHGCASADVSVRELARWRACVRDVCDVRDVSDVRRVREVHYERDVRDVRGAHACVRAFESRVVPRVADRAYRFSVRCQVWLVLSTQVYTTSIAKRQPE